LNQGFFFFFFFPLSFNFVDVAKVAIINKPEMKALFYKKKGSVILLYLWLPTTGTYYKNLANWGENLEIW
jgi:hypothetical protein